MILQLNVFLKQRARFKYKKYKPFERILLNIQKSTLSLGYSQKTNKHKHKVCM